MARADKFTPAEAQNKDVYSDFLINFDLNPITGNLAKVTNEDAVKQSIRQLLLTNRGERLYQPLTGARLSALLFENDTIVSMSALDKEIRETIELFEPRINVEQLNLVEMDYEIQVTLVFSIINKPEIYDMNIILQRVR